MGHFPARQTETQRSASRRCRGVAHESRQGRDEGAGAGRRGVNCDAHDRGLYRPLTGASHCTDAPEMWHTAEQGISFGEDNSCLGVSSSQHGPQLSNRHPQF